MKIRLLSDNDSLEELTALIRKAYRQLADMGLRYWGTHQTVSNTRQRIAHKECYVAEKDNALIGTILFSFLEKDTQLPWYARPEVAMFQQFAVDPAFQKQGIGHALLEYAQQRARDLGAVELACDTARDAAHLVAMYKKLGFREVGAVNWPHTNYTSLVLSKRLSQ